ncbi:MAG: smalltalk protein [Bacteroidaceae bacterium]|nr:smalltalk protein [Bacteroidaceae bacterium]
MTNQTENQKDSIWATVLRVVITILTALATTLGVQSCI